MNSTHILVLGIGNLLLGDEGVGIHVVQELQKIPRKSNVEILDGGTGGFELVSYFEGKKKILIIDAFKAELPAGTIVQSTAEELNFENENILSVHQNGLRELLYHSRKIVPYPQILFFGVVAKDYLSFSTSLTPEVQASIPALISMIMKEIGES